MNVYQHNHWKDRRDTNPFPAPAIMPHTAYIYTLLSAPHQYCKYACISPLIINVWAMMFDRCINS